VRQSARLVKLAQLDIPDEAYNWLVDFFEGHSHSIVYREKTSTRKAITASIIQGSGQVPSRLERRGLARDDDKRPDGMTSMHKRQVGVSCWISLVQMPSQQVISTKLSRVMATGADTGKRLIYSTVDDSAHIFQPIAIETFI